DDTLLAARHVEERQAELLHVPVHVLGHLLRLRVGVGTSLVSCRDDVIERAERPLGHAHLELQLLQHLEGLRRRHLVDEVQADQELGLAGRQNSDCVSIPHLVEQRACHENPPPAYRAPSRAWSPVEQPLVCTSILLQCPSLGPYAAPRGCRRWGRSSWRRCSLRRSGPSVVSRSSCSWNAAPPIPGSPPPFCAGCPWCPPSDVAS